MEHAIGYTLTRTGQAQPGAMAQAWLGVVIEWYERYSQRQQLRRLDDHLLADIGLTRAQAVAEARKPFWVA